jgi:pSer/pThr/pTyr-binding forkhead associated (FHA) protein
VLEDLRSKNGTFLGQSRIAEPVELRNGDRIGVGPALLVVHAGLNDETTVSASRGPSTTTND